MSTPNLVRRATAEALGTALLLAIVVGSGIMAERLAGGNVALALLANTIATGAGLVALILALGPISGAHFNPAVTLADPDLARQQGHHPAVLVPEEVFDQLPGQGPASSRISMLDPGRSPGLSRATSSARS
jgi:hypothetical protein